MMQCFLDNVDSKQIPTVKQVCCQYPLKVELNDTKKASNIIYRINIIYINNIRVLILHIKAKNNLESKTLT